MPSLAFIWSARAPPSPKPLPLLPLVPQGNRERYYEPCNSLLDSVLTNREGIPISLAVLHTAVAVRAGLSVTPLDLPLHVVCGLVRRWSGVGAGQGRRRRPC